MQTKYRLFLELLIKIVSLILLAGADPPIIKSKEIYLFFNKLSSISAVAASHLGRALISLYSVFLSLHRKKL